MDQQLLLCKHKNRMKPTRGRKAGKRMHDHLSLNIKLKRTNIFIMNHAMGYLFLTNLQIPKQSDFVKKSLTANIAF